jgi:hypothetical protein
MNERGHTNSVPWMYAIGPKNPLVKLNEGDLKESKNCVHSWYGVGMTAFSHGTELMRFGTRLVWFHDSSHSMWFLCTLLIGGFYVCDCAVNVETLRFLMSYNSGLPNHLPPHLPAQCQTLPLSSICAVGAAQRGLMQFYKFTLRRKNIKWLWPAKVTLEVLKRSMMDFCWSCDEGPL